MCQSNGHGEGITSHALQAARLSVILPALCGRSRKRVLLLTSMCSSEDAERVFCRQPLAACGVKNKLEGSVISGSLEDAGMSILAKTPLQANVLTAGPVSSALRSPGLTCISGWGSSPVPARHVCCLHDVSTSAQGF